MVKKSNINVYEGQYTSSMETYHTDSIRIEVEKDIVRLRIVCGGDCRKQTLVMLQDTINTALEEMK